MLLVIQCISNGWLKKDRGGKGATLRNRIPEAVPLIGLPNPMPDATTLIRQYVPFGVNPHFRKQKAQVEIKTCTIHKWRTFDCVQVRAENNVLFIQYAGQNGAPARFPYPVQLQLNTGDWVRVRYNGRFTDWEGNWYYRKTVLNIGLFEKVARSSFLGEPTRTISDMADLW